MKDTNVRVRWSEQSLKWSGTPTTAALAGFRETRFPENQLPSKEMKLDLSDLQVCSEWEVFHSVTGPTHITVTETYYNSNRADGNKHV